MFQAHDHVRDVFLAVGFEGDQRRSGRSLRRHQVAEDDLEINGPLTQGQVLVGRAVVVMEMDRDEACFERFKMVQPPFSHIAVTSVIAQAEIAVSILRKHLPDDVEVAILYCDPNISLSGKCLKLVK